MIRGEAKIRRRRTVAACPDVKALREKLTNYVGMTATFEYLASLVGCSPEALADWEKGRHRPMAVFAERLAVIDKRLSEKTRTLREELGS